MQPEFITITTWTLEMLITFRDMTWLCHAIDSKNMYINLERPRKQTKINGLN